MKKLIISNSLSVSGCKDGEGNVIGHPMKRQDSKRRSTAISSPKRMIFIYNNHIMSSMNHPKYYCLILFVTMFFALNQNGFAQDRLQSRKARKQLLDKYFNNQKPLIVYGLDTLSLKEYLTFPEKNASSVLLLPDSAQFLYGSYGTNGVIQIWSPAIKDRVNNDPEYDGNVTDPLLRQQLGKLIVQKFVFQESAPVYIIDDDTVSQEQFLCYRPEPYSFFFLKAGDYRTNSPNGAFFIQTEAQRLSDIMFFRNLEVREYRKRELVALFGYNTPQFLLNGKEMSKNDFLCLPEDSISIINYYTSSFVRQYYTPDKKNGIVYVEPTGNSRNLSFKQIYDIPFPSEERCHNLSTAEASPTFDKETYVKQWLQRYCPEQIKEIHTKILISCVVKANGQIKPICVIDILGYDRMERTIQKIIVDTTMSIVESMPVWTPKNKDTPTDSNVIIEISI